MSRLQCDRMDSHVNNCVCSKGKSRWRNSTFWMGSEKDLCCVRSFFYCGQSRSHRSPHRSFYVRCERLTGPVKILLNNYSATNKTHKHKINLFQANQKQFIPLSTLLHTHTQIWVKTVVRAPSPPPSLRMSHNPQTAAASVNHKSHSNNKQNKNSRTLSIHYHHHHNNNQNHQKWNNHPQQSTTTMATITMQTTTPTPRARTTVPSMPPSLHSTTLNRRAG